MLVAVVVLIGLALVAFALRGLVVMVLVDLLTWRRDRPGARLRTPVVAVGPAVLGRD